MPFNDWGQLRGDGTAGWNASTNQPKLASGQGQTGFVYKVVVAGTTSIDGNASWAVNDFIYFDGDAWQRITRTGGSGAETFLELLDTPGSYAGAAGQLVAVNGAENALEFIDPPVTVTPIYDVGFAYDGIATAGAVIGRYIFPRAAFLASGASPSQSKADVAATSEVIFTLAKNGGSFGTCTFAAAGSIGTFAVASAVNFVAGDVVTATVNIEDATLDGVSMTLAMTRP